jgi:uncharacterized protein
LKVEIRELAKIDLKQPTIIEGFPGVGMIGTIACSYLAEKLEMELVGSIYSTHFPPLAAIHDYKPISPARVYASRELNLMVLYSEFVIPTDIVYALSQEILDFSTRMKAKAIYSLAGIASEQPDSKIYGIASNKGMADALSKKGIELIKEGATQGVSGVLIAECASRNFNAANLMAQTNLNMDPNSAARLLGKLSEVLGIKVDTRDLLAEGKKISEKMRSSMEKMKTLGNSYQKMQDNPMYS